MREDLKLMHISSILGVSSLIILMVFSICLYGGFCYCISFEIASNIIISIFAGVAGSCVTLFLTKLSDYRQKRKDRLIEYFGYVLLFHEYTKDVRPIIKSNAKEKGSYRKYYNHPDLLLKIRQSYRNLHYGNSKKDISYKILSDKIYNLIEGFSLNLNRVCFWIFDKDIYFGSASFERNYLKTCTKDIFKIVSLENVVCYTNKTSFKLIKLLNKLQLELFNKETRLIPEGIAEFYYTKKYLGEK